MDNLFEILLPLIFFAIYFLSQFFGKKEEDGEGGSREEESSMPEEMRRVREELRRKIEERKKTTNQGESSAPAEMQSQRESDVRGGSVLRESRTQHRMEDRRQDEENRRTQTAPETRQLTPRDHTSTQDASYWEQELQEKMKEVQRTRERADTLREETRKKAGEVGAESARAANARSRAEKSHNYRRFLRESLGDPENLRRSFILHEVFGTPVGARRKGEIRPSWEL